MSASAVLNGTSGPVLLDAVSNVEDVGEFSHYRRELKRAWRPLKPIAEYPAEPTPVSAEGLRGWVASPQYRAADAMFGNYPDNSLCARVDRVLLYHLTRCLRPQNVVEIGSYFTASSEVIARGLWENGGGTLHTIDPFGRVRVPALMANWDERLRSHVRFYAWNSMQFFQHACDTNLPLDLVFVDGNHDFEYALFELQSTARLMRPGGIVVMDNINQSGPLWAAKVFLQQNPGWTELGECLAVTESASPFSHPATLLPCSHFLLMQAPQQAGIGSLPFSTGQVRFDGGELTGVDFLLEPEQFGELTGRVFLRGFPPDQSPEEIEGLWRVDVSGETRCTAVLDRPLQVKLNADGTRPTQTTEVVALWRPAQSGRPLRLAAPPRVVSHRVS